MENKPPAAEGVCDKCGGKLVIRKDDKPETIKERLSRATTSRPNLCKGYYEKAGKLNTVDGTQEDLAKSPASILAMLGGLTHGCAENRMKSCTAMQDGRQDLGTGAAGAAARRSSPV